MAAAIALYSVHLFGFAMACLVVTVYALVRRQPLRELCLSWLAFAPGLILFLSPEIGASTGHHVVFGSLIRKPEWLLALLAVRPRPVDPANLVVFALFAISMVVAVWRNTDLRWHRDWGKVSAIFFILYLLLPGGYVFRKNFVLVDGRLLPFMFLAVVAAVDTGRRGRWFATAAILIFVVRMASLTQHFLVEQPRLARLAGSFEAVSANAHILPIWALRPGKFTSLIFEPNHFWSYGVIHRGWVSPYLFSTDVHGLRPTRGEPYPSFGHWSPQYEARLDWERVRTTYEYVWAYNLPQLSPKLHAIGELVFADEGLAVFKMRSGLGGQSTRVPPRTQK